MKSSDHGDGADPHRSRPTRSQQPPQGGAPSDGTQRPEGETQPPQGGEHSEHSERREQGAHGAPSGGDGTTRPVGGPTTSEKSGTGPPQPPPAGPAPGAGTPPYGGGGPAQGGPPPYGAGPPPTGPDATSSAGPGETPPTGADASSPAGPGETPPTGPGASRSSGPGTTPPTGPGGSWSSGPGETPPTDPGPSWPSDPGAPPPTGPDASSPSGPGATPPPGSGSGGSPYDRPSGTGHGGPPPSGAGHGGSPYDQPPGAMPPPPPPYGGPGGGYGSAPYGAPDPRLAGMPPLAGLGRRLLARIIDALIVYVPFSIFLTLIGSIDDFGDTDATGTQYGWGLFGVLIYLVYEGLMLTRSGQTVGKKLMSIRVGMLENGAVPAGNPGWIRAAVYSLPQLVPCVGALFWLYNVLSCTWDKPYRQCLHDKAAKTVVVSTEGQRFTP
ncbi:RDD family protein [Streptomyces sp. 184]|uniref:RDD family protein n=1 Tax=Streptomyces sp. 184 TaxID=1827526 RepID=UPI00389162AD